MPAPTFIPSLTLLDTESLRWKAAYWWRRCNDCESSNGFVCDALRECNAELRRRAHLPLQMPWGGYR